MVQLYQAKLKLYMMQYENYKQHCMHKQPVCIPLYDMRIYDILISSRKYTTCPYYMNINCIICKLCLQYYCI